MVSMHDGRWDTESDTIGAVRSGSAHARPGAGRRSTRWSIRVSFGEWLTQCRQNLDLSRAELAARIGCAVVTLRKIEADERRPSRQMAEQLAEQLAIPPHSGETASSAWRAASCRWRRLPLLQAAAAGPTHLPAPTTALAGRAREVDGRSARSWRGPRCGC